MISIVMKLLSAIQSLRGVIWLTKNYRAISGKLKAWSVNPKIQACAIGVMLLCLTWLLVGCGKSVLAPQVTRLTPPQTLLISNPLPVFNGTTNEGFYLWCIGVAETLGQCNADKQAIRDWVAE